MNNDIKRYLENWSDERNSIALYLALADLEKNPQLAEIYRRLAATEQHHADAWAQRIADADGTVPSFRPAWRTRMLIWLARRFGIRTVLPSISSLEDAGSSGYAQQPEAKELVGQEQS